MSIFRSREGGQTKSKREREGAREREEEDEVEEREGGCEEKINLHSASASGQRQLKLHSTINKQQQMKTEDRK